MSITGAAVRLRKTTTRRQSHHALGVELKDYVGDKGGFGFELRLGLHARTLTAMFSNLIDLIVQPARRSSATPSVENEVDRLKHELEEEGVKLQTSWRTMRRILIEVSNF